ncbi:hypothetical protein [Marinomonas sp. PE14-40]|uniref:hypothetical protein n=1 Tax=Marinomonas sp. PE14-40 TaxID=3060621 RepID=UPI003F677370
MASDKAEKKWLNFAHIAHSETLLFTGSWLVIQVKKVLLSLNSRITMSRDIMSNNAMDS